MSRLKTAVFALAGICIFAIIIAEEHVLVINSHESLARVYVDGVQHFPPNANFPNETDNITLPSETRLLAVQATSSIDFCAGFIGSVTVEYSVTNSSWKCSPFGGEDWYLLGFDDTRWSYAYEVGRNGIVPGCPNLAFFPEISLSAYWIWTAPLTGSAVVDPDPEAVDKAVFCRGYLPFCAVYQPCQNGGTCLENDVNICLCPPEYIGRYCEQLLTPCVSNPCQHNATCIITGDSYVCECASGYTGVQCEYPINRTLSITAKSTIYDLFIDGVRQNLRFANNWTVPDNITLSPTNRLIAVMAVDSSEMCAGIIASVTGDFLVTDSSWRCSPNGEINWQDLGWPDDAWEPAFVLGSNYNVTSPSRCGDVLTGINEISENANWLWNSTIMNDNGEYHQTLYCRAYIPICEKELVCLNGGTCHKNNETICACLVGYVGEFCGESDTKTLSLTAKQHLYAAYVDGRQIQLEHGNDWKQPDTTAISSISRLVAVMAIQLDGVCPGILVSVNDTRGDYVVSNATWKCSPSAPVGWADLGFDDSSWPAAVVYRKNDFSNDTICEEEVDVIDAISPDAYWIWTDSSVGQHVTVYCRGMLPICAVHPCTNGGTCNENARDLCLCRPGFTGVNCENVETTADYEERIFPTPDPGRKDLDNDE